MNKRMPPAEAAQADVSTVSDETLDGLMGYRIKRAFNVIQTDLTQTLKPFELRMITFTALAFVVDNPGLRQVQLADALDIERPNLVAIVDELEGRGLLVREPAPGDRRAHALKPTEHGLTHFAAALDAVKQHERRMFGAIPAETRDRIAAVMSTIRKA